MKERNFEMKNYWCPSDDITCPYYEVGGTCKLNESGPNENCDGWFDLKKGIFGARGE